MPPNSTVLAPPSPHAAPFGVGRIMDASYQGLVNLRALDRVAQATHGKYVFTREMEPSDQAMNMWFSDFLRMKHDSYYATRQWKRPKEPGEGGQD